METGKGTMIQNELQQIQEMLDEQGYVADREIVMAIYLAMKLNRPLLVEGPAGVGKTEIAKVMARAMNTDLIRLQCYEGLDSTTALYEWNYQHQLLHIKLEENSSKSIEEKEAEIFSEKFLLKRPLLQAITHHQPPVLLIDELDRADEEFESFLLELLSDWQISIPEIGTIRAAHIPYVVITSNRTRELSDAVRRRCLYLWIDYPDFDKEVAIVERKTPGIDRELAEQITRFMETVRQMKLYKTPGVAETLDWARALVTLHQTALNPDIVEQTLGVIFKDWNDIQQVKSNLSQLLEQIGVSTILTPEAIEKIRQEKRASSDDDVAE